MAKFYIQILDRQDNTDYKKWFFFQERAYGATIFHHPDFLSYHGNKYTESHLGFFKGNELFGLVTMAVSDIDGKMVAKSPYGASYGGFIFSKTMNYNDSKEILELFKNYLLEKKINKVIIVPPIDVYYKYYSGTFVFAMLEVGFKFINSDITSVVYLVKENLMNFNSRAKRAYKKSLKFDLDIKYDAKVDDFWFLMLKTFKKHGVPPTHSLNELLYLKEMFLQDIKFSVVYYKNAPVAGIAEFKLNNYCLMSFYICQDDKYRYMNAQTYLIKNLLDKACFGGFKYFDFGTSSLNMVANPNIFSFKEGLGSIGKFRHTLQLNINLEKNDFN